MATLGSKYSAYPEYKDSGVEWFSSLPKDWETSQIRYLFAFNKGLTITRANLVDSGIPCISYGEVHSKYGFDVDPDRDELRYVSDNFLKSDPNSLLNYGDFIFADTSEDLEGSGNFSQFIGKGCAFAGYHTIILKPDSKLNSRYFAYLFDSGSFRHQIQEAVKGVKVFSITQAILRNCDVIVPSYIEQTKIAQLLDHETTKIDQLIEKQQKLIKLLEEKRQAVISHAVTKGLDPNVEMKDSGVEWLGEVPKHWETQKFKYIFTIQKRIAGRLGFDVLSITQRGIVIRDIESGAGQLSMDYSKYQLVNKGDFAMNQMDLLTGFVDISKYDGVTSPDYRVFTLEQKNSTPQYYLYLLQMCYLEKIFFPLGQGAAHIGRWRLPAKEFNNFIAPLPPLSEQKNIVSYVTQFLDRYKELTQRAKKQIELLKERRMTLISAAVTGKIDVRDWEMPER